MDERGYYRSGAELIVGVSSSGAPTFSTRRGADDATDTLKRLEDIAGKNSGVVTSRKDFHRPEAETGEYRSSDEQDITYFSIGGRDARIDNIISEAQQLRDVTSVFKKPAAEPAMTSPARSEELAARRREALDADDRLAVQQGQYQRLQRYLGKTPGGLGVDAAKRERGGKGAGVNVFLLEGAWRFSHEDLRFEGNSALFGDVRPEVEWRDHGTAVAAIIGAMENGTGVVGLAPEAKLNAVSIFTKKRNSSGSTEYSQSTAEAINFATSRMNPGDVLVLAIHRPGPVADFQVRDDQRGYIPIEWWPDDYQAIKAATRKGIIVVSSAGNGAEDLSDRIYDQRPSRTDINFPAGWKNPFRRQNDSGSILVGAGEYDRVRLTDSNYGDRVDAQGWGQEVVTAGFGDLGAGQSEDCWYTGVFRGTSSAAPMVAGAIACLQGISIAERDMSQNPNWMRMLLRSTGSAQKHRWDSPSRLRIGSRPDLAQMIQHFRTVG